MLDVFLGVSRRFKIPISRPYSHILSCWLFLVVAPGYCQTTVNSVSIWLLIEFHKEHTGGYVSPSQLLRGGGMAAVLGSALLILAGLLTLIYLSFLSPDLASESDDTV